MKAAAARPAHRVVLERAPADPQHRLDHDHQHGGLQAEEQALDDGDLAEQHVDPAQRHDGEQARQHEQRAGDQAALGLVHQPADIDRELLRLGAGQQRAVVQRLQETLLADPLLLLDDDAVHHRDLAGRAAEGQRGDARPHLHRLAERNAVILHLSLRSPAKDRRDRRDGAAAREPLLVVVVRRGDAGDQGADAGGLLAAVLAVLQVDVVDDLADRAERGIGEAGSASSTSKVQRSPRWVNSPSNMSKRSSPGAGT